jgi:hypothetical protein
MTQEELDALETEGGYRLDVLIKPEMPLGQFSEEILVETDHPKEPLVRIDVIGRMIGAISAVPDHLELDVDGRKGGAGSLTLWVRGRDSAKFEVAESPEKLKVAIAPVDDQTGATGKGGVGKMYRMTVTVPPGTPPCEIKTPIVLKTDVPEAAEVKIPVHAVVYNKS